MPEKPTGFGQKTLFTRRYILREENIWAVRVTLSHRAVGTLDDDTVTWFWIGDHDDYEKFF